METVRNGQRVWPFCKDCGCRLIISQHNVEENSVMLCHFGWSAFQDARGCLCVSVNEAYYLPKDSVKDYEVVFIRV